MRDLLVLVPDKNTEYVVKGALRRTEALGIRPIDFQIVVDPGRDGGVRRRGVQILRVERLRFGHALLIFDHEGSGAEGTPAHALEDQMDLLLSASWNDQAKSIVIEPEVDVWLWGAESHIRHVVAWPSPPGVREWLQGRGFLFTATGKPVRPKEATEAVFRQRQVPRSSAAYESIARRVSLKRCEDAAFLRLKDTLQRWFG